MDSEEMKWKGYIISVGFRGIHCEVYR